MDLPVCPACGQSVIDDDAVDCPFCGSSLKAKPGQPKLGGPKGKAPTAPAPKAPPTAAPAKATGSTAAGGALAKRGSAAMDDDDPFGVGTTPAVEAIAVAPQPSRPKPNRVVCPMCDTPGFVPADASGKAVRCHNPRCLAPVFVAPAAAPAEPVAPPAPPPRQSNPLLWGGVTAAVVCVGGIVAYFVAIQPDAEPPTVLLDNLPPTAQVARPTSSLPGQPQATTTEATTQAVAVVAPVADPRAEWLPRMTRLMTEAALRGGQQNRSKPLCRQLMSETRASLGDTAGAEEELRNLDIVGRDVPYYKIGPLAELYWQRRAGGEAGTTLKPIVDRVAPLGDKLPKFGRQRMEAAAVLGAVLIAEERGAQALSLFAQQESRDLEGQVAALKVLSLELARDRADRMDRLWPVLDYEHPQTAAAIGILVARGAGSAAQQFVEQQLTDERQTEARIAFQEFTLLQTLQSNSGPAVDAGALEALAANLPNEAAATLLARLALVLQEFGQKEVAAQLLTKGRERVASEPPAAPFVMPSIREIMAAQLPDGVALRRRAKARFELAHAAAAAGNADVATEELKAGIAIARSVGPSLVAIAVPINSLEQSPPSYNRDLFKRELGIRSDDEARLAISNFRRGLEQLERAAATREHWQLRTFQRALHWGIPARIWGLIETSTPGSETSTLVQNAFGPEPPEVWMREEIVGELVAQLSANGPADLAESVRAAWSASGKPAAARRSNDNEVRAAVAMKNWPPMVARLQTLPSAEQARLAMVAMSQLASSSGLADARALQEKLPDVVIREETARVMAGLTTRRGEQEALWKLVEATSQSTEKCEMCRGLAAALPTSH